MQKTPITILFFLPSLNGGGAERVVLTLLRHLDRTQFLPKLVLLEKSGRYLDQIPDDVAVIDLNVSKARYSIFKVFPLIRREKPDIVFTTLAHLNLMIAPLIPLFGGKTRFIARESNTVSVRNKDENYPAVFDWLYRNIYRFYDTIITQAAYMKRDLEEHYAIDPSKMVVIYNPVDADTILQKAKASTTQLPKNRYNLLAVGRLDHEKGFDMLIEIMTKLDKRYHLTILGEGAHKEMLQELIKRTGLDKRVKLAGFVQNPYPYMQKADLLVLPSRYEGLPNVVLEANVCGTPVVAFDAPGGTAEIINHGENGFLVPAFDTDAFARTVEKASACRFDTEAITRHTTDRYGADKIIQIYEALFSEKMKH